MSTTAPPSNTPSRNLWLSIRRLRGEVIRYRDGDLLIEGTTDNPLKAVPTQSDSVQVDGGTDAIIFKSDELQWLIDPAELVDGNGDPVEPREGATIELVRLSTRYEIKPTDGVAEAWRYSDAARTWYRINSAKVVQE